MPRRFFRRFLPDHHAMRKHGKFNVLGDRLHEPNLWHLNRRSLAGGLAVGLFTAFMPIPFQTILAAVLAVACRVNLPLAVVAIWITNPLTIPAIFYFAYRVGVLVTGEPTLPIHFELSFEWLAEEMGATWKPLLLGSFICGVTSAALGYVTVRLIWRWIVVRQLRRRNSVRRSECSGDAE